MEYLKVLIVYIGLLQICSRVLSCLSTQVAFDSLRVPLEIVKEQTHLMKGDEMLYRTYTVTLSTTTT